MIICEEINAGNGPFGTQRLFMFINAPLGIVDMHVCNNMLIAFVDLDAEKAKFPHHKWFTGRIAMKMVCLPKYGHI